MLDSGYWCWRRSRRECGSWCRRRGWSWRRGRRWGRTTQSKIQSCHTPRTNVEILRLVIKTCCRSSRSVIGSWIKLKERVEARTVCLTCSCYSIRKGDGNPIKCRAIVCHGPAQDSRNCLFACLLLAKMSLSHQKSAQNTLFLFQRDPNRP